MSTNKQYHDCECIGISNRHSCVARSDVNIILYLLFFVLKVFTIVDLGSRVRSACERCGKQMAETDMNDIV